MNAHARIECHAAEARAEIAQMKQRAIDAIAVKVGYWIRSDAQKRRREKERSCAN